MLCDGLIQEERLADGLDLWDCALEVEGFAEDDLENLLNIDAVTGAAEDQTCAHGFGESSGLSNSKN